MSVPDVWGLVTAFPYLFIGVGFLQWLIPALLGVINLTRQNQAQADIEAAEEAEVPIETSAVEEEATLRGLKGSSGFANLVAEPRRKFQVARRVARARDILQNPGVNPFTIALQAYAQYLGQQQGSHPPTRR